ncbi:KH domain RNA binding protein YlqC [Geomicrobium sp. JCM 19037]|uniref:KH domain-containing protein n=1 Tax=unclassified Geomicrobium TaxID=2628951 RepID=UPI00045F1869|nr:KH domain-containing protein [Geomicrobium sp. JCM 19037]GAK04688.1 KH domain RNA binding protein YlqC [Geomicrobium sp. JCM 19037]
MLKKLVLTVAQTLVDHPEDVHVDQVEQEGTTVLTLSVHKEDMGKVIGKSGKVASALRTVLAAANRDHGKVRLNIAD